MNGRLASVRSGQSTTTQSAKGLETSLIGSYDGSVGLAAQEGRDFLDQAANRGRASAPIEASWNRRARRFRSRLGQSNVGVAGGRAERRAALTPGARVTLAIGRSA